LGSPLRDGREVLASRADRTELASDRKIGAAFGVDHKLISGYLRTLRGILSDLFPELVDVRMLSS
jgi:hypothetical protein